MQRFSELHYLRPDGESLLAAIDSAASALKHAGDYPAAREIFLNLNQKQLISKTYLVMAKL